ncbi:MAG: hypothetical protein AAF570_23780 [Bacteroidota bacterium]
MKRQLADYLLALLFFTVFAFLCSIPLFIYAAEDFQDIPCADYGPTWFVAGSPHAQPGFGAVQPHQTIYLLFPETTSQPIYIHVRSPHLEPGIDEADGVFDSQTAISVYGGQHALEDSIVRQYLPYNSHGRKANRSGSLLESAAFGVRAGPSEDWFTFGPFVVSQGDPNGSLPHCIGFKVIVEGISGNDLNLFHLRTSHHSNPRLRRQGIPGMESYTYTFMFRMPLKKDIQHQVAHFFPYVETQGHNILFRNFDGDYPDLDEIEAFGSATDIYPLAVSQNAQWKTSSFFISPSKLQGLWQITMEASSKSPVNDLVLEVLVRDRFQRICLSRITRDRWPTPNPEVSITPVRTP